MGAIVICGAVRTHVLIDWCLMWVWFTAPPKQFQGSIKGLITEHHNRYNSDEMFATQRHREWTDAGKVLHAGCCRLSVCEQRHVCGLSRASAARVSWVLVGPGVPACAGSLGKRDVLCAQALGPPRRHREQVLLRSVQCLSPKGFRCLRTSTLRLKFCVYHLGVLICPVYHFRVSDCASQCMIINTLGLSYYASYATLY